MEEKTTKERIISEAEKQFIDYGIANTQMKDIAEAVNINRRTLYRYFKTKDVLAFEVELIIMKQIREYMSLNIKDVSNKTGFDLVKIYFENVKFEEIKRQMRFTGEFDRYFQGDYPTPQLEETFVLTLKPSNDQLYHLILKGIEDGSIRNDLSCDDLYHFIGQNFFAMFQRLILREKHLKNEYCDKVDFQSMFKEIILSGIKNKCS